MGRAIDTWLLTQRLEEESLLHLMSVLLGMISGALEFGKLYAYPRTSNGGLLFYRKDLLDKYNLQPPTTFDERKAACDTITAGEKDSKLGCYAGQFNKYEGLTVNFGGRARRRWSHCWS
jgi:ABC-type glycerol-3-phosphate transport system substrate-binding protein